MDTLKKERIALEVIKTLKSRFDNFPEDASDNRNAPFHEAFLEAFRLKIEKHVTDIPIFVSLSSWMHGLNTTLGQSFFENCAHILCDGEKREFTNLLISANQQNTVNEIITSLKNKKQKPALDRENEFLFNSSEEPTHSIQNFTADVYFEDDDQIVAIELKTVKPNSGIFKGEKEKILYAKAGLKNKFSQKDIYYFIGFPFDPLNETKCGYNKERFFNYGIDFKKFFDSNEVLLADELWDFLSEEKGTMEAILEIINSISKPDFMEKYDFINDYEKLLVDSDRYKKILQEWYLNRDYKIATNIESLLKKGSNNKSIKRILKQKMFDKKGLHKENRTISLLEFLNN